MGGSIGFEGDVERLALGAVEELWDLVALAVWPSRQAMLEVMQSPGMQEISVHRAGGTGGPAQHRNMPDLQGSGWTVEPQ